MKSKEKNIYDYVDINKSDKVPVLFFPKCTKNFQQLYYEKSSAIAGMVIIDNFYKIPCISLAENK